MSASTSDNGNLEKFQRQMADSAITPFTSEERALLDVFSGCINCGLCLTACEVLTTTTPTPFVYPGPRSIGISLSRSIPDFWATHDVVFLCTMCGACEAICPSSLPIPQIVSMLRARINQQQPDLVPASHRAIIDNMIATGNIYGTDVEPVGVSSPDPDFAYFAGCVGTFMERDSVSQTVELLGLLGQRAAVIDDLCCGGPCQVGGFAIPEIAVERVRDRMRDLGLDRIVTSCPRCAITFKTASAYRDEFKVQHITEFLADLPWQALTDQRVTFHDPCELSRHQGITRQPRAVLGQIAPGFIEMPHNGARTACCGAGGGLRGVKTRLSIEIARERLVEAIDAGAEVLLTECYSCLHNFFNARRSADTIEVYNLSEYLCRLLKTRQGEPSKETHD